MPTSPDVEFCSSGQVAPEHEDGACPIPCDLAALDAVGLRVDACVSAGALAYSFPNLATYPSVRARRMFRPLLLPHLLTQPAISSSCN